MLKLCTVTHGYFSTSQDESGMHPTKHPNTKSAAGSLPSPLSFKRKTDASWYRSSLASAGLAMIIRDSHSFYQGFSHFLSWRFRLLPPKLESCSKRYRMVLPAQTLFGTLFQSILVSCHPLHSRIQMNSLTDLTRYKYPRGGDFQSDCGTGSRYHHYPLFLYPWNNHSCRISHYS